AGYVPQYRETGLDDEAMAEVRAALNLVLSHHEPYPGVVMDRHWNIQQANDPARAMFAFLLDDGATADGPPNLVRLRVNELRPFVANWEQTGEALVQRVHREAGGGVPDPQTAALLDEVLALPGIPEAWRRPDFVATPLPMVPVQLAKDGIEVSHFS